MGALEGLTSYQTLKDLTVKELKDLAKDIREEIIEIAKANGGHLASNLGVVELTIALHYVFDLPTDKLIFDVGHQCYTHKILTGRLDKSKNLRQTGGISGFPDIDESEFDQFTTGHAGTALASGIGLATARDLKGENYTVISVVGDGSFSNGLSLEALMTSAKKPKQFIAILNDNGMSISKNRNGFYKAISKSTTSKGYLKLKSGVKKVFGNSFVTKFLRGTRNFFKRIFNKSSYYIEQFGFKYVGDVDGNDLEDLVAILTKIKSVSKNKAVFLHVNTVKGAGLDEAEKNAEDYHGVGKGLSVGNADFSNELGEVLIDAMSKDESIVPITAGMLIGTGLQKVYREYPTRVHDVGIAEEYAVTYAAGLARGGAKPIVCVYSTFMQRAYDQILHDVCLNNLPVTLCLDRAGLVGADGKTHQGVFDLSYLLHMPNINLFAPGDTEELKDIFNYAISLNKPCVIRYPNGAHNKLKDNTSISNGLWGIVEEGEEICFLAVGPRMIELAKEINGNLNISATVINARSVKPLDTAVLNRHENSLIITLEENSLIGGFGCFVKEYFANKDAKTKVINFGIKDNFVEHGDVKEQMRVNGLTVENVLSVIEKFRQERN